MSQAARMVAKPENRLIEETSSSGTLKNCAQVVGFVSLAAASIDHGGGVVDGHAVAMILDSVDDALRYEAARPGKAEAQRAFRQGESHAH